MSEKIQKYVVTLLCCVVLIILCAIPNWLSGKDGEEEKALKIGFLYVGDESTPYTYNFIKAQRNIENTYGNQVEIHVRENVVEGQERAYLEELVKEGCELIFTTSYGYGETVKEFAGLYPNVQFCQATSDNANVDPVYDNYHTFMGHIYEGRYTAGIVAGLKLRELVEQGVYTPEQIKIGYVGAFPYAEVISGYTAFLLGVREYVPEATMVVKYTYSWDDYGAERAVTTDLIEEDCVLISQHSDTIGPAVACESAEKSHKIYHVGYNQSMMDVAPTTSLVSCRINWNPYFINATQAVLNGQKIESSIEGTVNGNDIGAGFLLDWVQMLDLNTQICPENTKEIMDQVVQNFCYGKVQVFKGDYIGINPYDRTDTYDLNNGYEENATASAPTFGYVIEDIITVEE